MSICGNLLTVHIHDHGCTVLGGAGGKGTWGKLVEVYDEGPAKDCNDPNYDSAEEVGICHFKECTSKYFCVFKITGGLRGHSNTA